MHVIIVETKQCGIDWLFQNQPIHRCKMEKITKKKITTRKQNHLFLMSRSFTRLNLLLIYYLHIFNLQTYWNRETWMIGYRRSTEMLLKMVTFTIECFESELTNAIDWYYFYILIALLTFEKWNRHFCSEYLLRSWEIRDPKIVLRNKLKNYNYLTDSITCIATQKTSK